MTTTAPKTVADEYAHFAAAFAAQGSSGPEPLRQLRDRGWQSFLNLGLPTARRGNEPWKYTNVAPIARTQFSTSRFRADDSGFTLDRVKALAPWEASWRTMVLIDGTFAPHLSSVPETGVDIIIAPLSDAVAGARNAITDALGQLAGPEVDGFTALNSAFAQGGVGVYVCNGADAGVVNIICLSSGSEDSVATHPRTVVNAAPNSRVTVIETFVGPDQVQYLTNAVTEIRVQEGAQVEHYRLLLEGNQAFHVGTSRVEQDKDSTFSSVAIAHGSALGRNDFGVLMDGTGAECTLNGLYLTQGTQHIDNYINIDHAKPNGTSRLFYKGILNDNSRAVFGGNVTVRKDAQKTDAQQTDKNLLLSPLAEVDSKPSLLIYADDVKCGHGATAGHIDADTVFYMRSRGLDLPTASRILIHAFASEIIDTVSLEPLRHYLDTRYQNSIPDADISFSVGGGS